MILTITISVVLSVIITVGSCIFIVKRAMDKEIAKAEKEADEFLKKLEKEINKSQEVNTDHENNTKGDILQ